MKKSLIFSLIFTLVLGVVGCSNQSQNTTTNTDKEKANTKKIVVRYPNTQWFDAVYIADKKGYFAEQGIEIKYIGEIPSGQIVPSVASGNIDFGLRHTPLVALARAQGSPLKIVAAGTQTIPNYPHMRYVVRKDSGINDITQLAGKKTAINSFGGCSEYVSKEFLSRKNIKEDIKFVVLPDAQQEQALEQKSIDVAVVHAPFSKKATENPNLKEIANDYALEDGISGMCPYFTNENFIKKNPEAVKGFVAAVAKASDWSKKNEGEAKQIIADKLGIKVSDVEAWNYYDHQIIQKEPVKWWLDHLEKGNILKPGQVKLEDLYTNEFNPNKS